MTFRQATAAELRETFPYASDDFIQANTESDDVKEARTIAVALTGGTKRQSKYNAVPTTYNGVVYHSKKEAAFDQELDLMLKAGEIDIVLRQVPFDLGAGIKYRADFVTLKQTLPQTGYVLWTVTVWEVKGMETPVWKLKHKLFKEKYPLIELKII